MKKHFSDRLINTFSRDASIKLENLNSTAGLPPYSPSSGISIGNGIEEDFSRQTMKRNMSSESTASSGNFTIIYFGCSIQKS